MIPAAGAAGQRAAPGRCGLGASSRRGPASPRSAPSWCRSPARPEGRPFFGEGPGPFPGVVGAEDGGDVGPLPFPEVLLGAALAVPDEALGGGDGEGGV